MYKITTAILSMFDIKRLKSRCNYPSCSKKPDKEVLIYEYTIRKNKGIATLYLCKDHVSTARGLVTKIKNLEPTAIIESKQINLK